MEKSGEKNSLTPFSRGFSPRGADRQEIEREIRLALQFLLRKLASYMQKRGRADAEKKRANLYSKYLPLIAQFCTELAGKKEMPDIKNMLMVRNMENENEKQE